MVQNKRSAAVWLAVVLAVSSGCSSEPEPTLPDTSLFELASDAVTYGAMEGWPAEVKARRVGEAFNSDVEQLEVDAQGRAWVLRRDKDTSAARDEGRTSLEVYGADGRRERVLRPQEGVAPHHFVLHPSGEVTLFDLRRDPADGNLRLWMRRLSKDGEPLFERRFEDAGRPGETLTYQLLADSVGQVEENDRLGATWSASRFAQLRALALGEDVVLMARTFGIKLYRLGRSLETAWDAQLVPEHSALVQLEPGQVLFEHLALDGAGGVVTALTLDGAGADAYRQHFSRETGMPDRSKNVLLQHFSGQGQLLRAWGVGNAEHEYVEGLAVHGGEAVVLARARIPKFDIPNDTLEFDMVLVRTRLDDGAQVLHRTLDLAREDRPLALQVDAQGRLFVGGTYDYAQADSNSQVDYGKGLLLQLDLEGNVVRQLSLSHARDVEVRYLALRADGRLQLAGMYDGPHSHTTDADTSLGFNRAMVGTVALP